MEAVIYLNIGNTNSQILYKNQLVTTATKAIYDGILSQITADQPCTFVVASVVPATNLTLQKFFPKCNFTFINWKMLNWINFAEVDPTTIGADRLCNLAALSNLKLPAMVIDFGTAITSEVLSADFQFLGGHILPGRQLSRLALEQHTAQLPKTTLTEVEPAPLGMTTVEAIQAVDSMAIGGIQYLISRVRKCFSEPLTVYATGGDSGYFCKHIQELIQTNEIFTLEGLEEIQSRTHQS